MDVSSLYTNIPHEEGMFAIEEVLNTHNIAIPEKHFILTMLNAVLKKNNFIFNGRHFLQTNGTAMGARIAPVYANLFMNYLEEKFIYKRRDCPRKWYRFIDDIFMVYRGTEYDLKSFLIFCNDMHPTIKFTHEYSKEKVVFLDLLVYVHGQSIYTDLYIKPTNSFSYLRYESSHNPSVA
jgi:hypothetical protein